MSGPPTPLEPPMQAEDWQDLRDGVELFNAGRFWHAHEAWEACWRGAVDPDARRLFQGLVQVTAGFHKLFVARDPASARRLLSRGLAKLDGLPSPAEGLDLDRLRPALGGCLDALARGVLDPADVPRLAPLLRGA